MLGEALTTVSQGQIHVVNTGSTVALECVFYADHFNLFDNPVVWRKTQRHEETTINIMSNINQPFLHTGRYQGSKFY